MKRSTAAGTVLWLILCLGVAAVFFSLSMRDPSGLAVLNKSITRLTYPVSEAVTWAIDGTASLGGRYFFLMDAEQQNRKLKKEVDELKLENQRLGETVRRLADLVPAAEYADKLSYRTKPARVLAAEIDSSARTITIDLGENDGIKPEMGVITPDGVAGVVMRVLPGVSLVRLVVDPKSAVDAAVADSNIRGLVRGVSNPKRLVCEFDFVEKPEHIKDGDLLVTSGLDQRFPPGLKLGVVDAPRLREGALLESFTVRPSVDFTALAHVLVITGAGWTGGWPQ